MMLEIFVAAVCSTGNCEKAISGYYIYNPTFKDRTEEILYSFSNHIDPSLKEYIFPAASVMFNKHFEFSLNSNEKIYLEFKETTLVGVSSRF